MEMQADARDRARGAVVASAVGDALGSSYEFGPPLGPSVKIQFGWGVFGHDVGEWTDDTAMSIPVLQVLARGGSLADPEDLAWIVGEWIQWSMGAKDVGNQTRAVLGCAGFPMTEEGARLAAKEVHGRSGRSGGNGSLMRTGPVALGFLGTGQEEELVAAAVRVAELTHWESDNGSACALWCLAIRHAILTGDLDMEGQVRWLPESQRNRWERVIGEALQPSATPEDFHRNNGWVVAAFQGALAAVAHSACLMDALTGAVRGGGDTDTVAAIAGSLAGAIYGQSALPKDDVALVHGWPDMDAAGLTSLVDEVLERDY